MTAPTTVVVIGGGPAGLSAALWLLNLGLTPLLVERQAQLGGMQNLNFLGNDWVLGQPGVTGPELSQRFADHVVQAGITPCLDTALRSINRHDAGFSIQLEQAGILRMQSCAALVIATGTRYRAEDVVQAVPGFDRLAPASVAYGPHAFSQLEQLRGQRVLIVGGGDNAFENARLIVEHGGTALLASRTAPRAQQVLRKAVTQRAGYQEFLAATLLGLEPSYGGSGRIAVRLALQGKAEETLTVDKVHVLAGYEPNTAFLQDLRPAAGSPPVVLDRQGYIVTDSGGRTSAPGIYAAGDVANPDFPNVVSAVAQGAQVAKTIELDLRDRIFFGNSP